MQLFDEWKAHYPLDGIMIKLADSRDRLRASHNGVISNWSVAWKPPIQTEETRVTDIELNVSRHGSLVPTLIYEPVNLCGTTNTKVTANNMTWLLHQGIDISSRIVIGKAGEIIPQVIRVLDKRRPSIPSECPMCGGPLEWAGVHLTCVSSDCVAKTHEQLTHFYGHYGIDVPGIGPGRIESLLNYPTMLKMLRSSPWALLDPRAFALMDILQFVWGQKRFESYLDGLDQIQKTTTVVHFISALGYPSLGYKTALRLLQEMRGYTIKSGVRGSKEGLNSFVLALNDLQRASQELVNFEFQPVPPPPKLIYTITGTLSMPRQELITYLEKFDWQFVPRHSSNIDLLIVGDTNKVTTKLRVAQEHGTPQVLEHELPEWLPPTTEEENKNAANKPSKADGRD
jgi:NAD-dependent DNA ligase